MQILDPALQVANSDCNDKIAALATAQVALDLAQRTYTESLIEYQDAEAKLLALVRSVYSEAITVPI